MGLADTNLEYNSRTRRPDSRRSLVDATERGLLGWPLTGTLVLDTIDQVDCSVVLAGTERSKSIVERLFG